MSRIIFATGNEGKMREIRMIMADTGMEILSMKEAGVQVEAEENGKTYEENALIKARAVAALARGTALGSQSAAGKGTVNAKNIGSIAGDIVLADDSGLEVDFLNKEPGIYSARYLGEDTPYSI